MAELCHCLSSFSCKCLQLWKGQEFCGTGQKSRLIFEAILFTIQVGINILMMAVGAVYMNDCNAEPMIPFELLGK